MEQAGVRFSGGVQIIYLMDIIRLYQDFSIKYQTEGHKHCRPGWVNVECPFCTTAYTNPGLHLGATLDGKIFSCWRCGIHYPDQVIAKLLKISLFDARKLIIDYAGVSFYTPKDKVLKTGEKQFTYPSNILELLPHHKKYLEKRGFDPDLLEKEWGLLSTGPISILDKIDYGHRILAPIYWSNKVVTFQTRDVTNLHPVKYLACPTPREILHHKHIFYRHPQSRGTTGICVEGITDVWRFGRDAFATFGCEFTRQQVRLIAQTYKRVGVCFDNGKTEQQAQENAKRLISNLRFRKIDAFYVDINGDPAGLSQEEANYIVKQIICKL